MKYEFLRLHRNDYRPLKKACAILHISRSGFYEYLHRQKSNRQIEREALQGFVAACFHQNHGRYGARRISHALKAQGIVASHKRIAKVLRTLGLLAKGTTRRYRSPRRVTSDDPRLNRIGRIFETSAPHQLWVGDITYITTQQGFLFLAVVLDVFARRVVGWSMSTTMRENLVIDALEQAIGKEQPQTTGLIFHHDQGTQYTSRAFQNKLAQHGITASFSRPGNPYDNAVAESFFKTLKRELIRGKNYPDPDAARQDIFKYIELYYNRSRLHSSLGHKSPVDYERDQLQKVLSQCSI